MQHNAPYPAISSWAASELQWRPCAGNRNLLGGNSSRREPLRGTYMVTTRFVVRMNGAGESRAGRAH